jgi:hypothetical protein
MKSSAAVLAVGAASASLRAVGRSCPRPAGQNGTPYGIRAVSGRAPTPGAVGNVAGGGLPAAASRANSHKLYKRCRKRL